MKHSFMYELVISAVLIVLIVLFLDPFMLLMPDSFVYVLMVAVILIFVLFSSFVWKEKAHDERDELHKMIAGRIGYLAGVGILIVGVIIETLTSQVDPWLIIALGVMVLAKLAGLIYGRVRH